MQTLGRNGLENQALLTWENANCHHCLHAHKRPHINLHSAGSILNVVQNFCEHSFTPLFSKCIFTWQNISCWLRKSFKKQVFLAKGVKGRKLFQNVKDSPIKRPLKPHIFLKQEKQLDFSRIWNDHNEQNIILPPKCNHLWPQLLAQREGWGTGAKPHFYKDSVERLGEIVKNSRF